ncbi:MAG TPA: hypothetical protein VFP60_12805 [Pseudolabrys sp.]|nr:hypothetical protein [Pseudolabrys sp.]
MTWGMIIYRAAAIISASVVLLAFLNFADNLSEGRPLLPVVALGLAGLIALIGVGCRHWFGSDSDIQDPAPRTARQSMRYLRYDVRDVRRDT